METFLWYILVDLVLDALLKVVRMKMALHSYKNKLKLSVCCLSLTNLVITNTVLLCFLLSSFLFSLLPHALLLRNKFYPFQIISFACSFPQLPFWNSSLGLHVKAMGYLYVVFFLWACALVWEERDHRKICFPSDGKIL